MATETQPPLAIEGSAGSRVRVILGASGSEWLLLLDEDDGSRKWQTQAWNGIPNDLAKQINNCITKGRYVKYVDFDSKSGAWFVNGIKRDGSGNHCWWGETIATSAIGENVGGLASVQVSFASNWAGDESCLIHVGRNGSQQVGNVEHSLSSRMHRINKRLKAINFVRLFQSGYFISDDEGTEWLGIGEHCEKELQKRGTVNDVAEADDRTWVTIRPNSYVTSTGVDSDLSDALARFYREHKQRVANRQREIQNYHREVGKRREQAERVAREARERAERERAEQAEREAREQEERERAEQAEREAREQEEREGAEQAVREARERQDRELAERLAREEAARGVDASASIANALKKHVEAEVESIEESKLILRKRQRSLKVLIDSLPPAQRPRLADEAIVADNSTDCVVCHNAAAIRAVVPCGHQCLCDDCSQTLSGLVESSRLCPLCRTPLESTLKIYAPR
jgi:hypothetical protein